MVKIVIAGANSQIARVVIDKLASTGKHEITALVRKSPEDFPAIPGLKWVQTTYEKAELVNIFRAEHTVLSFLGDLTPENETQITIINACIEANVKRFAPSEWSVGTKLEEAPETMPWYAGKLKIARYLKEVNAERKVLEYTRFQPGGLMEYLGYPRYVSKHLTIIPVQIDLSKKNAIVVEGSLDDVLTFTSVDDIAGVVALAVEYEGPWPEVGGIQGNHITIRELLRIGNEVQGPINIEWLKPEDLDAGELKTDNYPRINLPSIPADQVESFSKMATICILKAFRRGIWTVTDDWNRLLPDYKFRQAEEFLKTVFADK